MATSRKVPVATMDSYSRNHKYTETFFHYPTRNPHSQLQYQMRLSQKQIKTFQPKKKGQYQSLMYESALNPLAHSKSHHQPNLNVTGDRKRQVQPFSVKSTDPITLCYEVKQPQNKLARPFEATLSYTRDIQRRNYLPITRQYSRPNRNYHSQLGYSLQAKDRVRTKPQLNNSNNMNSTIQYKDNKMMRTTTCFDDFKYNSRK